ncbi:MAG: hypothetical protein JWM95_3013 [Gemmatimonadetes bacterium]|nr:hypothetical protein [Gemmatimonadota bacterium]
MHESTETVRADIEATRARMSTTIAELEKKVDVAQKIRDNPWPALAIAFGAGLALSASGADRRVSGVTADTTQKTASKLGNALDDVLATTVAGLAAAFQGRIDEVVKSVVSSIAGTDAARQVADASSAYPPRAD